MKARTFIDVAHLHAIAGNGGNGCCSFRREKYVDKGGPDGGDGGKGGSVILRTDLHTTSLVGIYYKPEQRAPHGVHGKGKQLYGRAGADLIIPVPCGTVITDKLTGGAIGELVEPGSELVVARGGRGGLGNMHWKTSTHQAPTEHTDGEPGGDVELVLELKILANAGLVGYPNAGKSSLLGALTGAHPKVAAYPFTTLNPIIGTLQFPDYTRITIADIPGLIDGAHEGVGLGHDFLRHVERASLLLFVLDMAGVDGRQPLDDYASLREELRLHQADLADRRALVIANKMDLPEARAHLDEFKASTGIEPLEVSATTGEGLERLKAAIREAVASPA